MPSVSFTIPADAIPPDFDPKKPLKLQLDVPQMPAFDDWPYKPPQDPDDPDSGGFDPEDEDALPPNPNGGGGSGALSGTGSLWDRINALEDAVNFATLTVACNEDNTVTGTINWGVAPPPP